MVSILASYAGGRGFNSRIRQSKRSELRDLPSNPLRLSQPNDRETVIEG